jgi:hypothetical protein
MTSRLGNAEPSVTHRHAATLMRARRIGRPFVRDDDRLEGIVTVPDVLDDRGRGSRRPGRSGPNAEERRAPRRPAGGRQAGASNHMLAFSRTRNGGTGPVPQTGQHEAVHPLPAASRAIVWDAPSPVRTIERTSVASWVTSWVSGWGNAHPRSGGSVSAWRTCDDALTGVMPAVRQGLQRWGSTPVGAHSGSDALSMP